MRFSLNKYTKLSKYFVPSALTTNNVYSFDKRVNNSKVLNAMRTADKLISHFFSPLNILRGKPVYTIKPDLRIVHVFYYTPSSKSIIVQGQVKRVKALNNNTVNNLGRVLNTIFKQISPSAKVQLRLVKLNYPYLNRHILAQYIALNTQDHKLVKITQRIFGAVSLVKNVGIDSNNLSSTSGLKNSTDTTNKILPSYIVGIKIQVSGRLISERSRPRFTVQMAEIGTFSKSNTSLVDAASFTTKNKKGAFTVKVWISQCSNV